MARGYRTGIVAGLFLLACAVEEERESPPEGFAPPAAGDTLQVPDRQTEDPAHSAPLLRVGADSIAIGTVRLLRSELETGSTLTLELNDVSAGIHAWEIRSADCATATRMSSTAASVSGTVDVGAAGFGEASAMLPPGELNDEEIGRGRYSLILRAPDPAGASVIACAAL